MLVAVGHEARGSVMAERGEMTMIGKMTININILFHPLVSSV
jgi:hypothetical protein